MSARRYTPAFALALLASLAPASARAQRVSRWAFGAEVGAGTMVHDFDHAGVSASTGAFAVSPRLSLRLVEVLSLQVGATYGRFFREGRDLSLLRGALGVRFEPRVSRLGRLWVDLNAGVFVPGTATTFGMDLGVGFDFALAEFFSVGPYVRFTQVWRGREGVATPTEPFIPQGDLETEDLQWWTLGVSFSLRDRPRPPRPHEPPRASPPPPAPSPPSPAPVSPAPAVEAP